jgi:hypothetical protein
MRNTFILAVCALCALAGCKRTDDGKLVIERPGEIDVKVKNDTLRLPSVHMPSIGTEKDTVTTPTLGVKEETLIVKKPVFGSQRSEVKKPVIRR